MPLEVKWAKSQDNDWHNLLDVDLDDELLNGTEGVYIIWHGGEDPAVVSVGEGSIWDQLIDHRHNPNILRFLRYSLFVTWALVPADQRDGVVKYLTRVLTPKNECAVPECKQIGVNLPWETKRVNR